MFIAISKHLGIIASFLITAAILLMLLGCSSGKTFPLTVLTMATGDISVSKAGIDSFVPGTAGMQLGVGDTLKSGYDSSATITFFEGSTLEVKADTQIVITSLSQTESGATTILLKQTIGSTISRVIKLLDPESRYEIETPSAVAGVRGTTMEVVVAIDGTTVVGNIEGAVSVIAQDIEVIIPVGQTASVEPGQPPSTPQPSEIIKLEAVGSNLTKNTGDKPLGAPENIDWWYWEITLKNKNTFGVTILKRWKQVSSPYVDKSEEITDSFVEAFGTDYIPPGGKIMSRNAYAYFPRKPAPYQATFTVTFYGIDDFGREISTSYSQTFTVD